MPSYVELRELLEHEPGNEDTGSTLSVQLPSKEPNVIWKGVNRSKILLVIIFVTGLICATLLAILLTGHTHKVIRFPCNSDIGYDFKPSCGNQTKCNIAAQEILQGLNKSVDPCDNFYEFACGGWKSQNAVPDYKDLWRASSIRENEIDNKFINVLQEYKEINSSATTPLSMAKDYFGKCVATRQKPGGNGETRLIWEKLEQFGGWPILAAENPWSIFGFDWIKSVVALQKDFGDIKLFAIEPRQTVNASQNVLLIKSPRSVGVTPLLAGKNESVLEVYTQYIVGMFHELCIYEVHNSNLSETVLHQMALRIALTTKRFEELDESLARQDELIKPLTVESLQELIKKWNVRVAMLKLLQEVYRGTGIAVEKTQLVSLNMNYFMKMVEAVMEEGPQNMMNFLHFEMARRMVPLLNLPSLQNFEDKIEGQEERIKRDCISQTLNYFRETLTPTLLQNQDFAKTTRMFENLKATFLHSVEPEIRAHHDPPGKTEIYMVNRTCQTTLCLPQRLSASNLHSEYRGVVWNTSLSFMEQTVVLNNWKANKHLSRIQEPAEIGCPWSLLSKRVYQSPFHIRHSDKYNYVYVGLEDLTMPFYHQSLPRSLIYGRLGFALSHEIAHNSQDLFFDAMPCLKDQYSSFSHNHETVSNVTVDGSQTLSENFADNAAMHVAYLTYLAYPDKHVKHGMKGLENYSNEQLFFIGFAQNWCFSATHDGYKKSFLESDHAPDDIRVLGTLKNLDDFSAVWECPAGSKMNPTDSQNEKRCQIW